MIQNYIDSQLKWKNLENRKVETIHFGDDVWIPCGFCEEFRVTFNANSFSNNYDCSNCPLHKKHCHSGNVRDIPERTMEKLWIAWRKQDQKEWVRIIKYFRRCMAQYKHMF